MATVALVLSTRALRVDASLAAALFAVGQSEVWLGWRDGGVGGAYQGSRPLEALMVGLFTLPLAVRRRQPMTALAVVCSAIVVQALLVAPELPFLVGLVPLMIVNYSASAHAGPRARLVGLAAVLVTLAVLTSQIAEMRTSGEILFGTFVVAGTWLVGDVVRRRGEVFAIEARRLEEERDAWTRAVVEEERVRIARELHDVVAHSVSLMGVQAGAARVMLEDDPESARGALRSVEETARQSVLELRRLLAVLREETSAAALAPQPGLSELERLAGQVRGAGLQVDLLVAEPAAALPPGIGLAAYRIVQEALTNVMKHAGAARAEVRIACHTDALELEVCDDGIGAGDRRGRGHGLIGMGERAALYGGSLEAGPRPEGGFRVHARLPLELSPS